MPFDELAGLDAVTLSRLVRERQVSAVETTAAAIDAVRQLDHRLNAFCTFVPEQAIETAQAIDARIGSGEDPGPLAGVPVGIKDLILTEGIRTTFGSKLYREFVPDEDDIAVARLRSAGAIVLGKTNAAEFGYGGIGHNPLFPTTLNPWDLKRTSGGSSAGSAAAVAAGICPMALGSDGGGSVRLPAAFTGVVGIKPTMGRIPLWPGCRDETLPGASGWESIEHYGPLTRTVADAALFLSVLCGPDHRDRLSLPDEGVDWRRAAGASLPKSTRLAWCPRWAGLPIEPDVLRVAETVARAFADALGLVMQETDSPFGDLTEENRAIVALETDISGLRRLVEMSGEEVSPPLAALLERSWRGEAFSDAITARKSAVNAMARFMTRYDLILTPTAPLTAFAIDRDGPGVIDGVPVADDAWSPCLYPANLTGQPAASVPAGLADDGLPVGLQFIGRRLDDATVITACAAFEQIMPWAARRPPVSVW